MAQVQQVSLQEVILVDKLWAAAALLVPLQADLAIPVVSELVAVVVALAVLDSARQALMVWERSLREPTGVVLLVLLVVAHPVLALQLQPPVGQVALVTVVEALAQAQAEGLLALVPHRVVGLVALEQTQALAPQLVEGPAALTTEEDLEPVAVDLPGALVALALVLPPLEVALAGTPAALVVTPEVAVALVVPLVVVALAVAVAEVLAVLVVTLGEEEDPPFLDHPLRICVDKVKDLSHLQA
mmetsp:Transcript_17358/g.34098  ORF Transcript_17358/g.34098 Transcript_17358/m.34098 type:complete len:243 (-) Transcript_17358:50-778(-)